MSTSARQSVSNTQDDCIPSSVTSTVRPRAQDTGKTPITGDRRKNVHRNTAGAHRVQGITTTTGRPATTTSQPLPAPKNTYSNCSHINGISCPACSTSHSTDKKATGRKIQNDRNVERPNGLNSRLKSKNIKNQNCSLFNSKKSSNVCIDLSDAFDSSQDSSIYPTDPQSSLLSLPSIQQSTNNNSSNANSNVGANHFFPTTPCPASCSSFIDAHPSPPTDPPPIIRPLANEPRSSSENVIRPSNDTRLIDMHPDQYVYLQECMETLRFIPEKVLKPFRSVYNRLMRSIVHNPQDLLRWKKFLLLPMVLLSHQGIDTDQASKDRIKEIRRRIELIQRDDWDQFTFGFLPKQKPISQRRNISDEKKEALRQKKIEQLAHAGEFSKAMKHVTKKTGISPPSDRVIQVLKSLHPEKSDYVIEENLLQEMLECHEALTSSSSEVFGIDGHKLRKWIRKKDDFIKPSLDGSRWEHLRALCGIGGDQRPDENEFVNLLASIISLLLDVKNVPFEVYDALRDNILLALQKDPNDPSKIRPVGMGYSIRKLCCIVCLTYIYQAHNESGDAFLKSVFGDLQYGMESKGTEKVFHAMNYSFQKYPDRDLFVADGINGFNNQSKLLALEKLHKYFPQMTPFFMQIYYPDSKGSYLGNNGVEIVMSKEGSHQGDVFANLLYCLSDLDHSRALQQLVEGQGMAKMYVDDKNFHAEHDAMKNVLNHLIHEGPKVGYFLNRTKSVYLLGRCKSNQEAQMRKRNLMEEFGLSEDMIRIHPDNGGNPDSYGATVLGSHLGTTRFIRAKLDGKIEELGNVGESITTVNSKQIQFLMLRWCFSQMLIHLQRNLPYHHMQYIIPEFMELKRKILEDIVEIPIDDDHFKLAQLNLADSGLGLFDSELTSHAAYVASFAEFMSDFMHDVRFFDQEDDLQCMANFFSSLDVIKKYDASITVGTLYARIQNDKAKKTMKLQHELSQIFRKSMRLETMILFPDKRAQVFFNSIRDGNAGKILEMAPKTNMHRMANHNFKSYIRMRLFMPQVPSCTCLCKNQVDAEGFHWRGGCGYGGIRTNTHDEVAAMLKTIFLYCDCQVRTAESHMFSDGRKGDLTVRGLDGYNLPQVMDVRVTSSVPANGGPITQREADDPKFPDKHLEKHAKEKSRKYLEEARAAGLGFLPLVIDTSGRMHKTLIHVLETALDSAAVVRNIPFSILKHYWFSALEFTLHNAQTRGMVMLKHKVLGKDRVETFETSDLVVSRGTFVAA